MKDFYLTLLSSMHYGELRKPSLERFLPHIIVFNALWWAKEALTRKISTSHYCLLCIMVSKGNPHLKDFYLTLLSSMHYGEQRKPSLERFLPHIIVFYALWWAKETLTWKISTSHYCLQCIMVSKGSPQLKDFYLTLLSSMHYGEQRKPSLERFLPHIIVFNALWWAKEAFTWKISTSHYCLQCIMLSKGSPHLKDFYLRLLSSMHYGEQRKPSLEIFLPHIIVFNALWWAKEALTWKISTSHYCLQCIMVSKGSPHLKDFNLTLLSSMHYGEQRKPSLERFLPHIIVFNALWWAKEALTWKISTSHYCLQCIMLSKGSPHLKDFYLTLLSSMYYGEQRKPSLERFLPHIIVFNALWWVKEALTWKISTSHYCLLCIMVSKGNPHLKDFYLTLLSSMHMVSKGSPHLKDFYLTLLSSMHYGEQRKFSLERFLPHIIVFNALWWAKEALTWKISTSHYCLQCIMVSKGSPHLKYFYLTLLSSMHYCEQRKPSLERFLPHIIVFNALWWAKEALTWKISTSHYCLQCIMVSKGSPHLKDFYLTLLSSMYYGEQRKPSLERFLPHIIVFNALWWAKEALTWKISTSHYCLQCIMVSKGSPHLKYFYLTLLSSMHYCEQRKPSLERFLPHIIVFNALWWAKEALTWKISTSHYCLQCIMVSKGSPHLKDFYLTLLSSMYYGEQRKPSLERFLPHIIVFNALWLEKEALTWKDFYLTLLSSLHYGEQMKPSLERFLPDIIAFNALWWAKEALTWKISTLHYCLQCIMVSKGSRHLKDFYLALLSSMHMVSKGSPHWQVGKKIICCRARHLLGIQCPSTHKNMNVATIL